MFTLNEYTSVTSNSIAVLKNSCSYRCNIVDLVPVSLLRAKMFLMTLFYDVNGYIP